MTIEAKVQRGLVYTEGTFYLVDLVCCSIFPDSDSESGFIRHSYSQLNI